MFATLHNTMSTSTKRIGMGCSVAAGCGCLSIIALAVISGLGAVLYLSTRPVDTHNLNSNGASLGFPITPDFVSPDLYTYQVGAFAAPNVLLPQPAFQVNLTYPQLKPGTFSAGDTGSFWLGAILDNDYFVQVGMISTQQFDVDGSLQWDYFWEMWDDQNVYRYGLEAPMSNYQWNERRDNTFTLRCIDPATGKWEFSVNDVVVGTTNTTNCATDLRNANVFWEITTQNNSSAHLPTVGPFQMTKFRYADDGVTLQPVLRATASYSYGRIVDGAEVDQANVCPPYGAAPLLAVRGAQFGSGLDCLEQGSFLWGG